MLTIGYGSVYPRSGWANSVVVIETAFSVIFESIIAGFIFAKISRPSRMKKQILWSEVAVINKNYLENENELFYNYDYNNHHNHNHNDNDDDHNSSTESNSKIGYRYLVFRLINIRSHSQLCTGKFRLIAKIRRDPIHESTDEKDLFDTTSTSSTSYTSSSSSSHHHNHAHNRQNQWNFWEMDFKLNKQIGRVAGLNASKPVLNLPWTIVHKIDEESPLWNIESVEEWREKQVEVIGILDGIDEASSHNLRARWSYTWEDLEWNRQFASMVWMKRSRRRGRRWWQKWRKEVIGEEIEEKEQRNGMYVIDYSKLSSTLPC